MVKSEINDRPTDEVSFSTHQDDTATGGNNDDDEGDGLGGGAGSANPGGKSRRKGGALPADDCSEITTENPPLDGGVGVIVQKVKEINDEITMTFPQKLHEILSSGTYDDIVAWLPHGQSFMIHKKRVFESEILGKFFKKSKFTSFTRKLNRWGFSRITRGAENGAYFHALFRRDQPRLCLQMSNRSGGNAGGNSNNSKFPRPLMEGSNAAVTAAATPLMPSFPMAAAAGNNFMFPGMYPFDAGAAGPGNLPFNTPQQAQQQQQQQHQQQNLLQQLQLQQLQLQHLQFQQQQQQMQAAFMQQHQMQAAVAAASKPGNEENPQTNNSTETQVNPQPGLAPQPPGAPCMNMVNMASAANNIHANNIHDWNMFQKFAATAASSMPGGPGANNPLGLPTLFPPGAMMNSFIPPGGMPGNVGVPGDIGTNITGPNFPNGVAANMNNINNPASNPNNSNSLAPESDGSVQARV